LARSSVESKTPHRAPGSISGNMLISGPCTSLPGPQGGTVKRSDQVGGGYEPSNNVAGEVPQPPVITGGSKQSIARTVRAVLRGSRAMASASALAVACTFSFGAAAQTRVAGVGDDSAELGVIVVTARREALATADERKKDAETVVDSVVADEAGLLPDNSVTEVLQRVSGVTMVRFGALNDPDHFSSEGSGIQIRGLSGVAARLNGRDVFSATNGGGLSFQDVTPELLSAVDVYKSATADLIEGGAGGQVDLRTRMPFDFGYGLQAQASAGANYGDLAKKVDPSGSLLLSGRWAAPFGDFGALVDLAYSRLDQKDFFVRNEPYYKQNISGTDYLIPGGFDYGFDQFERTRRGVYAAVQWAPTDALTVGQTLFFSKYQTSGSGDGAFITSQALVVNPAQSTFDPNNGLVKSPSVFTRDTGTFAPGGAMSATGDTGVNQSYSDTLDASMTVRWKPSDRWDIKGAFQFVNSISDSKSYDLFDTPPAGQGLYSINEAADQPNISFPASTLALYGDPANYLWSAHMDHQSHNDGQERAGHLDIKYDISEHGFLRSAQIGARYADRTEVDADNGYNWSPFCQGWNGCNTVSLASAPTQPGNISFQSWSNFFRGDISNPGGIYVPSFAFASLYNPVANVAQLGGSVTARTNPDGSSIPPYTFGAGDYTHSRSSNAAGYFLVRFASDRGLPFDGNFGVRIVKIVAKSEGFFQQSAVQVGPAVLFPGPLYYNRSGGRTTDRALPSLNLRFKPTETVFIRAAYTVTLDEPTFYDARANGNAGATVTTHNNPDGTVVLDNIQYTSTSGNPALRPTISHNTDLSFEWYPSRSTTAHLSAFYKRLNDTIIYGDTLKPVPFVAADGTVVTQYASVKDDFNAAQSATVKGAELGARTFFDKLPSPFNGLGVELNYTHINSNNPGDQYVDINGLEHHDVPIVGLSKNSYNLALMYEKTQVSVRLAYNWRSKYLMTTNSNGTNGSYTYYPAAGASGQVIGISLPIFADQYGELDLGTTYRPTEHIAVSLDLNNLTNATTKTLMGGYPTASRQYVRSWFTADRRIVLSLRYKL
jgi:iron complex outermembrane receptor protein